MPQPGDGGDPARILIVDDNPTNLKILLQVLEACQHTVLAATSGPRALQIAAEARPDLVLLDVMMPGMDGYEVCRRLKENTETAGTPVIFITASDQAESVVAGFRAGAVDYIPKPFRQEEVLARVRAHLGLHRLAGQLEDRNRALEQTNRQLRQAHAELDRAQQQLIDELLRELQTAHDLQMSLMPTEPPRVEGLRIAFRCVPAAEVGGDFFQCFHHRDRLAIATADVTGHGMEAAIPAVMFDGILDSQVLIGDELEGLFSRLNERLVGRRVGRTHVCFSMAQIELGTSLLRLANAGCPFPLHYQATDGRVSELEVIGYPLGVRADTEYRAIEVQLAAGDRLVLCSDGIMEARGDGDEVYGYERTAEAVRRGCGAGQCPEALLDGVLAEVRSYSGDRAQEDDQTVVVVEVSG